MNIIYVMYDVCTMYIYSMYMLGMYIYNACPDTNMRRCIVIYIYTSVFVGVI